MKLYLTLGVLCVFGLSSCSNEETISENSVKGNPIVYNVHNALISRAITETTTANLSPFKIFAISSDNSTYINDEEVSQTSGTWDTADTYYWPSTGTLSFYAYKGLTSSPTVTSGSFGTITETINDPFSQADIVYATALNQSSNPVSLNFSHALSEILLNATNETDLDITISGVTIQNVYNQGTFTFTGGFIATGTSNNSVEFDGAAGNISTATSLGEAAFVMPQTVTAATLTQGSTINVTDNTAYLKVTYKAEQNGTTLFDSDAYIPFSISWEAGKKYTYTLNFSETGNGGLDENGNPVFNAIQYTVTVTDWVEQSSSVEMDD